MRVAEETTSEAGTGHTPAPEARRWAALPPRVPLDELVAESDVSIPPDDPTSDPNRDVANRWGAGTHRLLKPASVTAGPAVRRRGSHGCRV